MILISFSIFLSGFLPGILNGLLGTGGGILAVAFLRHQGLSPPEAHATALSLMLPLSILSLTVYYFHGNFPVREILPFIVPALLGASLGSLILKKISSAHLRLIFALLLLYSAVRTLFFGG